MAMSSHDKKVIRSFNKWIKQNDREVRERRSVAARRFLDEVKAGADPIEAKKRIGDIYDLSVRQMDNIICGRALLTHDGAVDMQAKIQRIVARAEQQMEMIANDLQECLEDIYQAEREGVEHYTLEYEHASGGADYKGATAKRKSVPLGEARFILRNRYMDQLKKITSMVKDLVPDYVFQQNIYNAVNQTDVENELNALIKKSRIGEGVFKQ